MERYGRACLFFSVILVLLFGCGSDMMPGKDNSQPMKELSPSALQSISGESIFFGHQSVGFNIVDGIQDVIKENPQIKLHIAEISSPSEFRSPLIGHSRIGRNGDPISKINNFAEYITGGIGGKADFAFMKFCYVDITVNADIHRIFNHYTETMAKLKAAYPKTTFIHVTVPLTRVQSGPKAWIKGIIGKQIEGYPDNVKRNEFNDMLRAEYQGREPFFDIAGVESTYPDGRVAAFQQDGRFYRVLIPEYTDDGGHLNEKGRKIVARRLINFLGSMK